MFPVLRPLLNRGGAGFSISREETIERMRPHVARGLDLLRLYSAVLPAAEDREIAHRLAPLMPFFRTELGKLYETIFSAGGTAPTGVDIDFEAALGEISRDPAGFLTAAERDFGRGVRDEIDAVHHQERTRAILKSVAAGSNGRLDVLRELAGRRPARAGAITAGDDAH
jgi:hypothetical protein